MKKVITYGTYDLLHHGHIRLLERAKKLGDYLIVGVTSDNYDISRGKINNQQCLIERLEAIKKTNLADQIIIEEYEGQKIDDIKKYGVDIFTVGSDWEGVFDYLNDYCKVIYLERTMGVSSTQIRSRSNNINMGMISDSAFYISKFQREDKYVNGVEITSICTNNLDNMSDEIKHLSLKTSDFNEMLDKVDSVYIKSKHEEHYKNIKAALTKGKNVLCESPIVLSEKEYKELFELSEKNNCVLMEAIRTAYSTAYGRLLLMLKSGKIGKILSIDAVCTNTIKENDEKFTSLYEWGGNALLPIFQILGVNYKSKQIASHIDNGDSFTKINFIYDKSVASILVAEGAKSEGTLIITGTEGYIYVPSPWWKMDYFEVRYEDQNKNKRYYYQLEGEGIRYELVAFARAIKNKKSDFYISREISLAICKVMEDYTNKTDYYEI